MFDLEMIEATGSCAGIENYSRYLTGPQAGRAAADPVRISARQCAGLRRRKPCHRAADRRHVPRRLSPQIHARRIWLPPALLHRQPARCNSRNGTRCGRKRSMSRPRPAAWELEQTGGVFAEQVIRPTGLIDPPVEVRPAETQVDDLIAETRKVVAQGYRVLVTTLTKRMAEDLTEYMHEQGIRVRYMHSDVETLERIEIIRDLRLGAFDVLVGINLLREGPRHSRMRAGRHSRRRQGRLPAQRNLADPDHRPRRAQCGRQRDPVCRRHHRLDGARHGRNRRAAARSRRPTTWPTASRRKASRSTSATSWAAMYERDHVMVDAGAGFGEDGRR